MTESKGLVAGFLGATLLLAGVGALGALGALGSLLGGSGTVATLGSNTYIITISLASDGTTCAQAVSKSGSWGSPKAASWVAISESNNDAVGWVNSGGNTVTVAFPGGPPNMPGTPFIEYSSGGGNWQHNFDSTPSNQLVSYVATLTPDESAVNISRFPYQSVKIGGTPCTMPKGGMGITVTK